MAPPAGTKMQALEPRARVRVWELIAFQLVFGVCVAWRYDLFREFPHLAVAWISVLIHGAATALIVLALGDSRQGNGARFSWPGRISLIVCGLVGVRILSLLSYWDQWYHGYRFGDPLIIDLIPAQFYLFTAMGLASWNVFESRPRRFLWRWVPLLSGTLQFGSIWLLRGGF